MVGNPSPRRWTRSPKRGVAFGVGTVLPPAPRSTSEEATNCPTARRSGAPSPFRSGNVTQSIRDGMDDTALAWHMTDHLVKEAQAVFLPVWQETRGDNGYVSFELDPLLEDPARNTPVAERTR